MISFTHSGNFNHTEHFLSKAKNETFDQKMQRFGKMGVEALVAHTPKNSGLTADSWKYTIERKKDIVIISWYNTNNNDGFNIAIGLQYGHGTLNGSYVDGVDYINPALKPVFDSISNEIWNEVKSW